jgi:signal transduction histidine kinase
MHAPRVSPCARSLSARLRLVGAVGVLCAAVAGSWGLGEAFSRATLTNFDDRLRDDLLTLSSLVERGPAGAVVLQREPTDDRYSRAFSGHYWLIRHDAAQFRSRSLWDAEPELPAAPASGRARFADLPGPMGQRMRVAVQQIHIAGVTTPVTLWAASDATEAHARIREFRWYAGLSAAGLVVVLSGLVAWQVSWGLKPLREIVATLARVRAGDHRRLDTDVMPREVLPLANDLNALLEHQERMVRRARHGTDDLAHALKTPLAALQAAAERQDADLDTLVAEQVARMQATIDRQQALATVADPRSRTRVAEVASQFVALMRRIHAGRRLAIDAAIAPDALFSGERADLEEMLGNLLDNACKWAATQVTIDCTQRDGRIRVSVEDDGPGMTPLAAEWALRRGVRLDERVAGSGLGLAIVLDLADSYGGALTLARSALGGLAARLDLPAA